MTGAEGRENKSTTALVTYTNEPILALPYIMITEDFFFFKKYAVTVHGMDLSANMISIAMERQLNILAQGDRSAAKVIS